MRLIHARNVGIGVIVAGMTECAGLIRQVRWKFRPVFRRFGRDRRGTTAVEFALLANVFIVLVFLMIEASWIMTVEMAVNDAAQSAARLGSLGTLPPTGSREAAIQAAIVNYGGGVLNNSYLTVVMQSYGTAYDYGHHAANATQTSGAGSGRQLVQYSVTYSQPLMTPFARTILGASFTHSLNIMVQNEPF